MNLPRNWLTWTAAGALSLTAASSLAQDPRGPLLLVTTDRNAVCTVEQVASGATPLLVRVQPGSHWVTCTARIEGVVVRRKTPVQVVAGQHVRLRVGLMGETTP